MSTTVDVRRIATDPDAFETFYRVHLDAVHRFTARRVVDPHLALDLVADIFLAAIDAAKSYDPSRGSPQAWLYGIGRHLLADDVRRRDRERRALARLGGRRMIAEDALAATQERLDAAREQRMLYAALARLPDDQRQILELVALDELTLTDCARVLGVRPVTARVRLHRARRAAALELARRTPSPADPPNPSSSSISEALV